MTVPTARVLWVTDEPPDRGEAGGTIRQAHLFEALATTVPTDLLVAGVVSDMRVREIAASVTELSTAPAWTTDHPVGRRALQLAIALGSRNPSTAYPAGPVRRALGRELDRRAHGYDVICFEHGWLAPLLQRDETARRVITFQHLASEMARQQLAVTRGRRQRWFIEQDVRKARALERGAVAACDRAIVCSEDDAAVLAGAVAGDAMSRIVVVPNGVDLERVATTPLPGRPSILFGGTLGYQPNVDAAVWLCHDIWPRIRAAAPEATLVLAGRAPAPEVRALAHIPGVEVRADVPSMLSELESARVVVVPVRIGTGTRLKAIEAMAAGRPLVGTSIGLGGIGIEGGVHAQIADEPEAFAAAVVTLLHDDQAARTLAAAGRALVDARFGWERIGAGFVGMINELLDASD